MTRLNICLLAALVVTVVATATGLVVQQRAIAALHAENERLHREAQSHTPNAEIPGRYRWIENGKDRGFVTLYADRGVVGLSGKRSWGERPNRWFFQDGELVLVWGLTHTFLTQTSGAGKFSGNEGGKSVQIIKEP